MNKRLIPLQHTTVSCTVHKPDVPVIRLELREGCKIFYRVLLSPTFSGRQRHVIYLLLYCMIMKRQEENIECEGECVYDRVRNECRRARFGYKKIPAYDRTLYH